MSSSPASELEGLIERIAGPYDDGFESRLTGPYQKAWHTLIRILNMNGSEEDVYESLKRIKIELINEEYLKNHLLSYIEPVINQKPSDARAWLFEYVFNQVGSLLTIDSIWGDLNKAGYNPTEWYKNHHIITCFEDINKRYLRRINIVKSSFNPIFREETDHVLEKIESNQDVIITGSAGIGKSEIIEQVLTQLKSKNTPYFVLDLENNELAYSAKTLGSKMELPSSPVNVLENIAQGRKGIFIIDQLDSLSIIQGKKLGFMDCIFELIEQVKDYPNINLILVCRDFDLQNDRRINNIQKKYKINAIKTGPLNHEKLIEFIENELKLDPSKFTESQLDLLAIPLNLKLFIEIIESGGSYLTLDTEIELYNEYWDVKKRYLEKKLGRLIEWDAVLNILCEYISENQDLKAPKFILDKYSSDAEIMASEGVLTLESNYYSFFHGSFFDYSFARLFVSKKGNLLRFLLESEQYLFKRSQVRQILSFKRSFGSGLFNEYINDIDEILNSPKVRIHIKILILELFSNLNNPKKEEWVLIEPIILNKENIFYEEAWKTIAGSIYWFELLDSLGVTEKFLESKDWDLITKTIWILYKVMERTERVAELIEPYIGKSRRWNELIIRYIVWIDFSIGTKYYNILLSLIDQDIFENSESFRGDEYWDDIKNSVYKLSKTHPNRSIEIIEHYLKRKIELSINKHQPNPFSEDSGIIPSRSFEEKEFLYLAEKSSKIYVDKILPLMMVLMEINSDKTSPLPFKDTIWRYRGYKEIRYQNREILLYSMEKALQNLAKYDTKIFSKWARILSKSNFETAHYLLIRSLAANGEKYGDKAVHYLEKTPNILRTGYTNAPFWATRILIESISPYCSYSNLKRLEKILLNSFDQQIPYYQWVCTFHTKYCSDFYYYEYRNAKTQLGLLIGINHLNVQLPFNRELRN